MNVRECAQVLAKIQLVDNRGVDEAVILDWMDYVGDLDFSVAIAAVIRFRRERPGVYLEPGHLLELAGIDDSPRVPDIQHEIEAEWRAQAIAAAGVTEEEFAAHAGDAEWLRAHFTPHPAIESPEPWAKPFKAGDSE